MRQAIFRILAGLISVGYLWATISKPPALIDVPGKLGEMAIFAMFGVYALIGNRLAAATVPVRMKRPRPMPEDADHLPESDES